MSSKLPWRQLIKLRSLSVSRLCCQAIKFGIAFEAVCIEMDQELPYLKVPCPRIKNNHGSHQRGSCQGLSGDRTDRVATHGPRDRLPRFKSRSYLLLALWLEGSYTTFLGFGFFIYKMGLEFSKCFSGWLPGPDVSIQKRLREGLGHTSA